MSYFKKIAFALGLVILSAIAIGIAVIRPHYTVPILMYHSVRPDALPENRLTVSTATFEKQMRFLVADRYNVVPLEEIAGLLSQKKRIPAKTVAITFDDGYIDNYTYAYPILKKYNLPATIFIIVQEVSRRQNDRLSWDQILEMQRCGFISFGSHAIGADPLFKMKTKEALRAQIFDSKKILEEKLGRPVIAFSYPEGMFTEEIKQLVKDAGYKLAVATNPGRKSSDSDIYALKRMRISSSADNLFVFWAQASGYYTSFKEYKRKK